MADFAFDKGQDATVKLEGEILGGITKIVCRENADYTYIREVFTDEPVSSLGKFFYVLEFTLDLKNGDPFAKRYFDSIEIIFPEKTYSYRTCRVTKTEKKINSRGTVEGTVELTAEKREVFI